jgi:hypothetical protein
VLRRSVAAVIETILVTMSRMMVHRDFFELPNEET